MGTPPTEPRAMELWIHAGVTVAAYRDRYKVEGDLPLGGGAMTAAEQADRQRAQRALREAVRLSRTAQPAYRREVIQLPAVSAR